MIFTDNQLKVSKAKISEFEEAINELVANQGEVEPMLYQMSLGSLNSMLQHLKDEIQEYEDIKNSACKSCVFEPFEPYQLPKILIKARLYNKMSQSDLAAAIGVKPQQIQRYESTEYAGVRYETLVEIQEALNVVVKCDAHIHDNSGFDLGDISPEDIDLMEKNLLSKTLIQL